MLGNNVGVDLGTSSILIYVQGKGVVLNEPSVAAYDTESGKLLAVGKRAFEMLGRNPGSIRVVQPMRHGVVSDFTATNHILRYFLQKVCQNMIFKPNIVVCIPSSVTKLEQRTILDLVTASGAAKACLIEEPLAAALGAGLSINHPSGLMVVDIGAGSTDIAVITMGSSCISHSVRVAGNALDNAIRRYVRRECDVILGVRTAELVKEQLGCAYLRETDTAMDVRGKHAVNGLPVRISLTASLVHYAMRDTLEVICSGVRQVLENTPPELAGDLHSNGILLTGGGALLDGIDILLQRETGLTVTIAENPVECVALGTGAALKDMDVLTNNGYYFKSREEITGYRE